MRAIKVLVFIMSFALIFIISFVLSINYFFGKEATPTFNAEATTRDTQSGSVKLPPDDTIKTPAIDIEISSDALPSKVNFFSEVIINGKFSKDYKRSYQIDFSAPGEYTNIDGITSFRGNNFRNSASFGYADIKEEKLEKVWFTKTGYIDIWTGVGWNGQPSIVKWDNNVKKAMNIYPGKKQKENLKEVIYATLDGNIYFLDVDNGEATRPLINVGYPLKGSVTVDPRGYPLLYSGQGIDVVAGKPVPIGFRIFSLINQKMLYFIDGMDPNALRRWGAFDSNPLIDKKTDTLIECGENGIFYTIKLNTKFTPEEKSISINPEVTKYRYKSPKGSTIGTENSVLAYHNYAYFADNSGTLQCVDLNTLKPVWVRDVTDDTDSTMAIEETGINDVSLYTACEIDKQGVNGYGYVRKINALTGALIWEKSYKCYYDSNTNGGALASPVIGKNDIENLVIYNIARTGKSNGGKLVAFDKKTGEEIWIINLDFYCWSSPVDVYTKDGKSYLIVCDSAGNMFLIEGLTGRIVDKINLGSNVEGSPAVYDNMIVVGTRGQKIWGIKIK